MYTMQKTRYVHGTEVKGGQVYSSEKQATCMRLIQYGHGLNIWHAQNLKASNYSRFTNLNH